MGQLTPALLSGSRLMRNLFLQDPDAASFATCLRKRKGCTAFNGLLVFHSCQEMFICLLIGLEGPQEGWGSLRDWLRMWKAKAVRSSWEFIVVGLNFFFRFSPTI